MKNLVKIFIIGVIIIEIITYNNIVIAANKSELQDEKSNIANSISEAKDELADIEEEKSEALTAAKNLTVQISDYEQEIEELEIGIKSLETKILEAKDKIEEDEKEYNKNQQALNERLVAMYEYGDTSYLDYFLSSSSLTDFISNYYLVSEMADYDTQLLDEIEKEKNQLEDEKKSLEEDKDKLDSAKTSKQAKMNGLKVIKEQKEKVVANLSEQEKQTQSKIEELQADKAVIEKQLRQIAEAEEAERKRQEEEAKKKAEAAKKASQSSSSSSSTSTSGSSATSSGSSSATSSGTSSSSGFIFPVQGLSKANIRNKTFPSYAGHTGVDININVTGKKVVAAKSGTVVKSTALKNADGSYRSYGEYIMIAHGDGTITLYAHMLAGSRTVSEGQAVSQGQVIGTVGSTGNSTGTHLHFEVRVKTYNSSSGAYTYKVVNPLTYLP